MLKAIVFDFDGVLVDSEPLHYKAFLAVARLLGVDFDYRRYLETLIGYDDRDAFRAILRMADAPVSDQRVMELCGQKQGAFEKLIQEGVPVLPGAMDLLDQAAAAMPIAIASGATRLDIELILAGLGRRKMFQTIVSADDVERSKPDPASYALAVEQLAAAHRDLNLQPEHCLAIEDTPAGLRSAQSAGLRTLGVATTGPADRLHADRVVRTLSEVDLPELRAWFDKNTPARIPNRVP